MSRNSLLEDVSFDFIRYANCWEDADILCEALQPEPGKRVLSIASAGDNSLALLAEGAEVVAADLSPPQLACLELRCAAFRRLEYQQVLGFLGVRPAVDRLATYETLAADLSSQANQFWMRRPDLIASGVIHAGKFESYFRLFRRWFLPLIHSRKTCQQLLEDKNRNARAAFWRTWDNRRWRLCFHVFFSRRVMGWLGRTPEFFRYVEGDVTQRFMKRVQHGLVDLPTHANPFLDYIVSGNFRQALPRYLRPELFDQLRLNLDRLTLHHGSIEDAAAQHSGEKFDAFNLSDIFEYLDVDTSRKLYTALVNVAKPGARIAYWNALVPRSRPEELADRVKQLRELSADLFARDLAFFYEAFHVDEVGEG